MAQYDILGFLEHQHKLDPQKVFTIKEIAACLSCSERTVRRNVVRLEAREEIIGRASGKWNNWHRKFKYKE